MVKIITDEYLDDMSEYLTPDSQNAPCSNCGEIKKIIKSGTVKEFCRVTNCPEDEAADAILHCKCCLWFWVDKVEEVEGFPSPNSRAGRLQVASEEEMAELLAKGCCNPRSECVKGRSCFNCWLNWLKEKAVPADG